MNDDERTIPAYVPPEKKGDHELVEEVIRCHTPTEIPPCRVCGGKLSLAACGGGRPTEYRCNPFEDDPDKPGHIRPKNGRSRLVDDHYERSAFTDYRHTDLNALELAKRFRRKVLVPAEQPDHRECACGSTDLEVVGEHRNRFTLVRRQRCRLCGCEVDVTYRVENVTRWSADKTRTPRG